ncbi:hypothetical protein D3C85_320350 [compost metagenome]|jgi:hypothetical protein
MTNCFKKHWFLIIGILLLSNYSFGQTFLSIPDSIVKPNGRPFIIRLNPTSTIAEQCTSQIITLNIGTLTYLPGSNGPLPQGVVVTPSTNGGITILTISGIINDGKQGSSLTMDIAAQFKPGTCDYFAENILASTTNVGCGVPSNQSGSAKVISVTPNNAKSTIVLSKYINEPVCPNTVITYKIYADNPGNQGFNIKNAKVNLELDKCANVLGIYKENTYTSVNPTITTSNGIQKVVFDTPDLLLSPYSNTLGYDLFVTYPCVSGGENDCVSGLKNIKAYLTGTKSDCGLDMESIKDTVSTNTSVNPSQCSNAICPTGGGGTIILDPIEMYVGSNLPCPSCSRQDPLLALSFNVPPLYPNYENRVLSVEIPSGFYVTSALDYYKTGCGTNYEIRYIDALGNKQATPFPGALTRKIEFATDCSISVPSSYFLIYMKYDEQNPPQGNQRLTVKSTFTSNGTVILENTSYPSTGTCAPSLTTYNQVRKIDQPLAENNYNAAAIPGELLTYRFQLENNGTADTNNSVSIKIDKQLIYEGGFRYSYDNWNYYYAGPFKLLEGQPGFSIPELGDISVTAPIVGQSGNVNLSGFSFPCTRKNLYIEFDVRPRDNVTAGTKIPITTTIAGAQGVRELSPNLITVLAYTYVKSKMFVKCSLANEWKDSNINVTNGETVDFKMQFSNVGSNPVTLSELVNLRPQAGDLFEFGSNSRNSTLNMDYNCDLPTIFTNAAVTPAVDFYYALNSPTMDRDMLCPPQVSGNAPIWTQSCNNANWLKATFPNNFTLLPGEFVEVMYKGRATGTTGTAYNSFAFKVIKNGICDLVSANSNTLVIKNDDTIIGCNSCTLENAYSGEMKVLFENLMKNILTRKIKGETDAQINGSSPDELLALRPYITSGGGNKIYKFVSTVNAQNKITSIKFSFDANSENDVTFIEENGVNYNPEVGAIDPSYLKIDTTLYALSSQYLTTCRRVVDSNGTVISECNNKTQVKNIDFCPTRFCYPMSGEIKVGE